LYLIKLLVFKKNSRNVVSSLYQNKIPAQQGVYGNNKEENTKL